MKILARCDDGNRRIRVIEYLEDGSRRYYDGLALYTHITADGRNLLEYVAAVERIVQNRPTMLLLGTAGGALATQISRRGAQVTAVDDWGPVFDIARQWFHLPDNVECVHADAVEFVRSTSRQWDAVVIDVFRGMKIPDSMFAHDIGVLLARILTPGGIVVWNVADKPGSPSVEWISEAVLQAGFAFSVVSVLDSGLGNTLIVTGDTPGSHAAANTRVHKPNLPEIDALGRIPW